MQFKISVVIHGDLAASVDMFEEISIGIAEPKKVHKQTQGLKYWSAYRCFLYHVCVCEKSTFFSSPLSIVEGKARGKKTDSIVISTGNNEEERRIAQGRILLFLHFRLNKQGSDGSWKKPGNCVTLISRKGNWTDWKGKKMLFLSFSAFNFRFIDRKSLPASQFKM